MGSVNGIDISIIAVSRNKDFLCQKDCWRRKECDIKPMFIMNKPIVSKIVATEIIVDVTNTTDSTWSTSTHDWSLIDAESYSWQSKDFCGELSPKRYLTLKYNVDIQPHTTCRIYIYFPEINDDVAELVYSHKDSICRMSIGTLSENAERRVNMRTTAISRNDSRMRNAGISIKGLEKLYSRRLVCYTEESIRNIEQDIAGKITEIKQIMREQSSDLQIVTQQWLDEVNERYHHDLEVTRILSGIASSNEIQFLYQLSPREFEEWTADLFETLGYSVELTPYTGDGGVDVICEKNGKKIAIQCKRFNGLVYRPDVQRFMGAMIGVGADEGFFITTGTFTVGAQKAVQDTKVLLYDKTNLGDLIQQALVN